MFLLSCSRLHTTTLTYRNKQYNAHVLSSTDKEPHFHWLLFTDEELLLHTGGEDNVCFQMINGELVCSSLILRIKVPALVDTARMIIEQYLKVQQK